MLNKDAYNSATHGDGTSESQVAKALNDDRKSWQTGQPNQNWNASFGTQKPTLLRPPLSVKKDQNLMSVTGKIPRGR